MTVAAGVPTIWQGVLGRARGPRPVGAARDRLRRLGGAEVAERGLPREDRAADPAGVGHDRDEPDRLRRDDEVDARRAARRRARRHARDRGRAGRRSSTCASSTRTTAPSSRGTARRAASCRRAGRGSPPAYYDDERSGDSFTDDGWLQHRRHRDDRPRGLRAARRPHEGPHQVRRRVDQLGRAGERDHGPPAGARGGRDRRPGRALGRAAAGVRGARQRRRRDAPTRSASTSTA